MVDNFGTLLSYELSPRAKIFRRDQGTVVDMTSMQAIMRFNGMYLGQVSGNSIELLAVTVQGIVIMVVIHSVC